MGRWGRGDPRATKWQAKGFQKCGKRITIAIIILAGTICSARGNAEDIVFNRPRGVTVSTLDSESSDRGSNPREAFLRLRPTDKCEESAFCLHTVEGCMIFLLRAHNKNRTRQQQSRGAPEEGADNRTFPVSFLCGRKSFS